MASTEQSPIPMTTLHRDLLNECRQLQRTLDGLEERHRQLERNRQDVLHGTGAGQHDLATASQTILLDYRTLIERVRQLYREPNPSPAVTAHTSALRRRIESSLHGVQTSEREFQGALAEQQRRQYAIVRPDASETEIDAAVGAAGVDADGQIFRQALMASSTRSATANSTWSHVRQRHDELCRVQRTMEELGELFSMLAQLVELQDAAIRDAEAHAEDAQAKLSDARKELEGAVDKAKGLRRKKWIALGITVAIVVVIVVVALIILAAMHVI